MSDTDKFYTFLLTLSEETRIAYALFEAASTVKTSTDNVYGLCMIILSYHELYRSSQPTEKQRLFYEGIITKLDAAINGPQAPRDPSLINVSNGFARFMRSMITTNNTC